MENQLTNKVLTIDSREVAEMVETEHKNLLRKIDKINEDLESSNLSFQDLWQESTYKVEGNNKTYRNFLITKEGCDFLAHKTFSAKGNVFTFKYMQKFKSMEQQSNQQIVLLQNEIIKLKQEMQNMFTIFNDSMTNMANSFQSQLQDAMKLVQVTTATASEQLLKAKSQYKPSHKRKLEYNKLIKSMTYSDEAVETVTSLVLRHFNASKWEDVCADDDNEILSLIHDFAKIINDTKGVETAEQIKMVEVYPEPTQDNVINYFEYLFGGDKPIYKAGINKILVPKKAN